MSANTGNTERQHIPESLQFQEMDDFKFIDEDSCNESIVSKHDISETSMLYDHTIHSQIHVDSNVQMIDQPLEESQMFMELNNTIDKQQDLQSQKEFQFQDDSNLRSNSLFQEQSDLSTDSKKMSQISTESSDQDLMSPNIKSISNVDSIKCEERMEVNDLETEDENSIQTTEHINTEKQDEERESLTVLLDLKSQISQLQDELLNLKKDQEENLHGNENLELRNKELENELCVKVSEIDCHIQESESLRQMNADLQKQNEVKSVKFQSIADAMQTKDLQMDSNLKENSRIVAELQAENQNLKIQNEAVSLNLKNMADKHQNEMKHFQDDVAMMLAMINNMKKDTERAVQQKDVMFLELQSLKNVSREEKCILKNELGEKLEKISQLESEKNNIMEKYEDCVEELQKLRDSTEKDVEQLMEKLQHEVTENIAQSVLLQNEDKIEELEHHNNALQDKLISIRVNLQHQNQAVSDLISENGNLRYKYESCIEELQQLKDSMQKDTGELSEKIKDQQEIIENSKNMFLQNEAKLFELVHNNNDVQDDLNNLRAKLLEHDQVHESLQNEHLEKIDHLNEEIKTHVQIIENSKNMFLQNEAKLSELVHNNNDVQDELNNLRAKLLEHDQVHESLQNEHLEKIDHLNEEIKTHVQTIAEMKSENGDMQHQYETCIGELQQLKESNERDDEQLKEKLQKQQDEIINLKSEKNNIQKKCESYNEELQQLKDSTQKELEQLMEKFHEQQEVVETSKKNSDTLLLQNKTQIADLEHCNSGLQDELTGLRLKFQEQNQTISDLKSENGNLQHKYQARIEELQRLTQKDINQLMEKIQEVTENSKNIDENVLLQNEAKMSELVHENKDLQHELKSLSAKLLEQDETITQMKSENCSMQLKYESCLKELQQLKESNEEVAKQLMEKFQEQQEAITNLKSENNSIEKKHNVSIEELRQLKDSAQKNVEQLMKKIQEQEIIENAKSTSQTVLLQNEVVISELEHHNSDLNEELTSLRIRFQEQSQMDKSLRIKHLEEIEQLKDDMKTFHQTIANLETTIQDLEQQKLNLGNQLTLVKNDYEQLRSLHGDNSATVAKEDVAQESCANNSFLFDMFLSFSYVLTELLCTCDSFSDQVSMINAFLSTFTSGETNKSNIDIYVQECLRIATEFSVQQQAKNIVQRECEADKPALAQMSFTEDNGSVDTSKNTIKQFSDNESSSRNLSNIYDALCKETKIVKNELVYLQTYLASGVLISATPQQDLSDSEVFIPLESNDYGLLPEDFSSYVKKIHHGLPLYLKKGSHGVTTDLFYIIYSFIRHSEVVIGLFKNSFISEFQVYGGKTGDSENQSNCLETKSCHVDIVANPDEQLQDNISNWKIKAEEYSRSLDKLQRELLSTKQENASFNATIEEIEENLQLVFQEKQSLQETIDKMSQESVKAETFVESIEKSFIILEDRLDTRANSLHNIKNINSFSSVIEMLKNKMLNERNKESEYIAEEDISSLKDMTTAVSECIHACFSDAYEKISHDDKNSTKIFTTQDEKIFALKRAGSEFCENFEKSHKDKNELKLATGELYKEIDQAKQIPILPTNTNGSISNEYFENVGDCDKTLLMQECREETENGDTNEDLPKVDNWNAKIVELEHQLMCTKEQLQHFTVTSATLQKSLSAAEEQKDLLLGKIEKLRLSNEEANEFNIFKPVEVKRCDKESNTSFHSTERDNEMDKENSPRKKVVVTKESDQEELTLLKTFFNNAKNILLFLEFFMKGASDMSSKKIVSAFNSELDSSVLPLNESNELMLPDTRRKSNSKLKDEMKELSSMLEKLSTIFNETRGCLSNSTDGHVETPLLPKQIAKSCAVKGHLTNDLLPLLHSCHQCLLVLYNAIPTFEAMALEKSTTQTKMSELRQQVRELTKEKLHLEKKYHMSSFTYVKLEKNLVALQNEYQELKEKSLIIPQTPTSTCCCGEIPKLEEELKEAKHTLQEQDTEIDEVCSAHRETLSKMAKLKSECHFLKSRVAYFKDQLKDKGPNN